MYVFISCLILVSVAKANTNIPNTEESLALITSYSTYQQESTGCLTQVASQPAQKHLIDVYFTFNVHKYI